MDLIWQQVVIGIALIAAAGYLIWLAIRPKKQQTTCSRCHCNKKSLPDRSDLRRF